MKAPGYQKANFKLYTNNFKSGNFTRRRTEFEPALAVPNQLNFNKLSDAAGLNSVAAEDVKNLLMLFVYIPSSFYFKTLFGG
jgi:hypothetical protein